MVNASVMKTAPSVDRKIVSISSKRQITIPQKFFTLLGFGSEAECMIRGNELVIRPAKSVSGGEFAEQILADLLAQGLAGNELLAAFKDTQAKIRPAVESMLVEAEKVASGEAEYSTFEDVFRAED